MSEHARPGPDALRSLAWPPFAPGARPPLCFPLTRRARVWQQLLGMALYSLCMALSIAGCLVLPLLAMEYPLVWTYVLYILLYAWLVLFVLPASTAFCGVVFGSWRGALVAAVSMGGGLLLTQYLTSVIPVLQGFAPSYELDRQPPSTLYLLAGPLAALVVGLLYDVRHDEDGGKSLAILTLGMAIVLIGLGLAAQSAAFGWVLALPFTVGTFVLAGLEALLRKLLAPRKHRLS